MPNKPEPSWEEVVDSVLTDAVFHPSDIEMDDERRVYAKQALTDAVEKLVKEAMPEYWQFEDGKNDATYFYAKALDTYQTNLTNLIRRDVK